MALLRFKGSIGRGSGFMVNSGRCCKKSVRGKGGYDPGAGEGRSPGPHDERGTN